VGGGYAECSNSVVRAKSGSHLKAVIIHEQRAATDSDWAANERDGNHQPRAGGFLICALDPGIPAVVLGTIALIRINRSNGRLKGDGLAIAGIVTGGVTSVMIVPIMVALLLPAVQAAREAAYRNVAINNLKQISIALQNYLDTKGTFPAAAGGPGSQLSWRVQILPFVEEGPQLYSQFHLDEPWDSAHNRALLDKMPDVFKNPGRDLPAGKTSYLAVTGPGTAFGDGKTGAGLRDFRDGMSNTAMIVEADADQGVDWTKPDDWQFNPSDPERGLGKLRRSGFLAAFGDAHIAFIDQQTDPEVVKAMMTRDGGERVESR
jgi:hypothetical protein